MFGSNTITHCAVFLLCLTLCVDQVNGDEENKPPDGLEGYGAAFFALQSCHQVLRSDSAEFFSPDYLCWNPSLWCNWTIQVDPGKRIHLSLEDQTPDDACLHKRDQIHLDEPTGRFGIHKILQKCWREVKYTTTSNTLTVVLLIGSRPESPYRGFYGRYRAFGPPVVYTPKDRSTVRDKSSEPDPGSANVGAVHKVEPTDSVLGPPHVTFDPAYGDQSAMMAKQLWRSAEAADTDTRVRNQLQTKSNPQLPQNQGLFTLFSQPDEKPLLALGNLSRMYPLTAVPTVPASLEDTSPSGRDASHLPSDHSDSASNPNSHEQHDDSQGLKAIDGILGAVRRNVEGAARTPAGAEDSLGPGDSAGPEDSVGAEGSEGPETLEGQEDSPRLQVESGPNIQSEEEEPTEGGHRPEESEVSDQRSPHPNVVEPLLGHQRDYRLYEVTVEVDLSPPVDQLWDSLSSSLLLSINTLVSERLPELLTSLSTKRIKRLNAGVLFILWLQTAKGAEPQRVDRTVHDVIQSLSGAAVELRDVHGGARIVSVSTQEVEECVPGAVLCEVSAACVKSSGWSWCACGPDSPDAPRRGSGGSGCVAAAAAAAAGEGGGPSAESRVLSVLVFLLVCVVLLLLLLLAAAALYRRQRRGNFLVRCRSDSFPRLRDRGDGGRPGLPDSAPPPPPPPRATRVPRPGGEPPLLHFLPLPPPGGNTRQGAAL